MIERRLMSETDPTGTPEHWRIIGVDTNGDPRIEFYPTPNAAEEIHVYAIVSQGEVTADATVLSVPHRPVVLKAFALAVSERGEHGGNLYDEVMREFANSLNEAVAQDNLNVARGSNSDWRVV
jgi:type IV secretory pathway TrbF-like protein